MALDTAYYLVTKDIAERSGVIEGRYRTLDGRYVLDSKDLSRIRFTSDEYIQGLEGVEKISFEQSQDYIAKGGFKMGFNGLDEEEETPQEQEDVVEEQTQVEEASGDANESSEESETVTVEEETTEESQHDIKESQENNETTTEEEA